MNIGKRQFILLGLIALVVLSIPAVVLLSQKKPQDIRSKASASTTLYLVPSTNPTTPVSKNIGDTVNFDVMINPGQNLPSIVRLDLLFDSTKLQAATASAFSVNTAAFPTTLEGPILLDGRLLISVSIGSDTTKAIQQVTKIGTLTFTAKSPTGTAPTAITFGTKAQVLSISSNDLSNENVLSTTNPGYVSIAALPTVTLIPATATPIQPTTFLPTITTALPSLTITPTLTNTPTLTPIPTATPTPTATTRQTTLAFNILLHGIGNSGDNANNTDFSLSNKNPLHTDRNLSVFIYNISNQLAASLSGVITYNSVSGSFTGNLDAGNLPAGQYTIKVQSPTHLRRLVSGIFTINPLQTTNIPTTELITGDANGDNMLNILDYNLLIGCYSDLQPAISCDSNAKDLTDLNDDGNVNQVDYNLFLREITVQNGN